MLRVVPKSSSSLRSLSSLNRQKFHFNPINYRLAATRQNLVLLSGLSRLSGIQRFSYSSTSSSSSSKGPEIKENNDLEDESIVSKAAKLMREQKESNPPLPSSSTSSSSAAEDAVVVAKGEKGQKEIEVKKKSLWIRFKEEAIHYWSGLKLLAYEVKISSKLLWKISRGVPLIRREERQASEFWTRFVLGHYCF